MTHPPQKSYRTSKNPLHKVARLIDAHVSISKSEGVVVTSSASEKVSTTGVHVALDVHASVPEMLLERAPAHWVTVDIEYPEVDRGPDILSIRPGVHSPSDSIDVSRPEARCEPEERMHVDTSQIKLRNVILAKFPDPHADFVRIERMQTSGRSATLALPSKIAASTSGSKGSFRKLEVKDVPTRTLAPSIAAKLAVTRRRDAALSETQFAGERRLLASIAGIAESDIQWVGLFRRVPISVAQAIEIDEQRGILSLTLKPDAIEIIRRQAKPVVNLAIGRNKTTGAIVQTLVR